MDVAAVLVDGFDRVRQEVPTILDGLDLDALTWRPGPDANPIAWLVWHLARVQDDHVSDLAGVEQAWTEAGWFERFALPFPAQAHGFGQSTEEVAQVRVPAELLAGYHADVAARTAAYVATLGADELDRVVDTHWDPPVTVGVRLVSVLGDIHAHTGQAAYVRGLLSPRGSV